MGRILVVTWNGGGNVPPALGVADELRRRGHDVRVLGQIDQRAAVEKLGLCFEAYHRAAPHLPLERTGFARWAAEYLRLFTDPGVGADVAASLDREGADLVVVDAMLLTALHTLQARRTRHVVLHHTLHGHMSRNWAFWIGLVTRARGLPPTALWARADRVLVPGIAALEPRPVRQPNVRLTGPIWPVGVSPVPHTGSSRVLVSLSSIFYGGQAPTLRAVMAAVADLPVPVVLTTGRASTPVELDVPANVEAHGFVPHGEILPTVSMVVGHGGYSTTTQALAHDLPMVVLPVSSVGDQPSVGAAVARAGAGMMVRRTTRATVIREAICRMLDDGPHRTTATRLGAELRAANGAATAAREIEALLPGLPTIARTAATPSSDGPAPPTPTPRPPSSDVRPPDDEHVREAHPAPVNHE